MIIIESNSKCYRVTLREISTDSVEVAIYDRIINGGVIDRKNVGKLIKREVLDVRLTSYVRDAVHNLITSTKS